MTTLIDNQQTMAPRRDRGADVDRAALTDPADEPPGRMLEAHPRRKHR
jgi:hypothetical protein